MEYVEHQHSMKYSKHVVYYVEVNDVQPGRALYSERLAVCLLENTRVL